MKYNYETMEEYEKRNKGIIFYNNLNYIVWMLIVLEVCIALILQVETIWYKFGCLMFAVVIAIDSLIYAKEKREEFRIEKERQTKRK